MRILKLFGIIIVTLLVIALLISASVVLTIYNDWPAWYGIALFFAVGVLLFVICLILINLKTFTKWLWYILRRAFKYNSRLKYITYAYFKKGLDIQIKRRFNPTKWFRATPPRWFLVADLFDSTCDELLSDRNMTPMRIMTGAGRKNSKPCRWWFFHNAMYLSVPGKFIYKDAEITKTWLHLLRLIWWCRPPAGIIVSVPVDWLSQASSGELHSHARMLRSALGRLFKRIEKRLPVYFILTNMQLMPGAKQWLEWLDDTQPQGMTGQLFNTGWLERVHYQVNKAMDTITQSLAMQRLIFMSKYRKMPDSEALSFPATIKQLHSPLKSFLCALCEKDSYLEHCVPAGLFFTGHVHDEYGETKSVFSQYLLSEFIPQHNVKLQQQLVLSSWWLIRSSMVVLLTVTIVFTVVKSFYDIKDNTTLIKYTSAYTPVQNKYLRFAMATQLQSNSLYSILFYPALTWLERDNAWQYQKITSAQELSPGYINENLLSRFIIATPQEKAELIINWSRFINNEKRIAEGQSLELLDEAPEYSATALAGKKITLSYPQVMAMRKSAFVLGEGQNLAKWRDTLRVLINIESDLSWLLNAQLPENSHNIKINDYWPIDSATKVTVTSPELLNSADLPWIYTRPGEIFLTKILDEIQEAVGDTELFHKERENFWDNYLSARQNTWFKFSGKMINAATEVEGAVAWRQLLSDVTRLNSPYDRFLTDLSHDLSTIDDKHTEPWLELHRALQQQYELQGKSGLLSSLTRGGLLPGRLTSHYRRISKRNKNIFDKSAITRLSTYMDGLQKLAYQSMVNLKQTAKLIASAEEESTGKGKSATLESLFANFDLWKMASSGSESSVQDEVIWELYQGNAQLVRDYILLSSADQLQNQWSSKIIWPLNAKVQEESVDVAGVEKDLYKHIVDFIKQDAANTLDLTENGIAPHQWDGHALPFTAVFLDYINEYIKPDSISGQSSVTRKRLLDEKIQLSKQDAADKKTEGDQDTNSTGSNTRQQNTQPAKPAVLTLTGRPATANYGALTLPTGTSVKLVCSVGDQRFTNMNFNTQANFSWQPDICTNVVLTIIFPEFRLEKTYPGTEGIIDFMNDYSDGEHRYTPDDFSGDNNKLAKYNIEDIIVRYQISGQNNIISAYQAWQLNQRQTLNLSHKHEEIDNQLNNIDSPYDSSGILSLIPNNIVTPWHFSEKN